MNLLVATLCLNEMEWLPYLYEQHRHWPGMIKWVFVEAADVIFARTNPEMVSNHGLSVDGTTEYLSHLAATDDRVVHVKHGFCSHLRPDQGKCEARQRYLDTAEDNKPDFVMVLDADEFYTISSQIRINETFVRSNRFSHGFVFKQRHIWRPPSVQPWPETEEQPLVSTQHSPSPLFSQEVTGGYWAVPHFRGWRWESGMRYHLNHNWPQDVKGTPLTKKGRVVRGDQDSSLPGCLHLGYASSVKSRQAKARYYVARGEGSEGGRLGATRSMYVMCREAWERWRPGMTLPYGAKVVQYSGDVPEVFLRVSPASGVGEVKSEGVTRCTATGS